MSEPRHYPGGDGWIDPACAVTVVEKPASGYSTADEVRIERHADGSITLVYRKDRRTFPHGVAGFGPATGGIRLNPDALAALRSAIDSSDAASAALATALFPPDTRAALARIVAYVEADVAYMDATDNESMDRTSLRYHAARDALLPTDLLAVRALVGLPEGET